MLGHAAGTHVAELVLVEAEQDVAGSGPERRMDAPLEPDALGIGERVEQAAVDGDVERAPKALERQRIIDAAST